MANMRPMLAAKFKDEYNIEPELEQLQYPVLASPKIDGIRFLRPDNDVARSRSWTPLPNKQLQALVENPTFAWLDGEVIVGEDGAAPNLFNRTQSAIMTADDANPLTIFIFDYFYDQNMRFELRTEIARTSVEDLNRAGISNIRYLKHTALNNPEEVLVYEQAALEMGFEGIMIRSPNRGYKFGRSTLREQGLIKIKRFTDEEAEIIGFVALERNMNEQVQNPFGLAKRSSHKANKIPDNLLGKLLVRNDRWGEFAVGSGFDLAMREEIWNNQEKYLGRLITYKFQRHGCIEKPRSPIFKGFRPELG